MGFLPPIIGHRGAAAYAPENTFAAFNSAYSLGCRFIELDVMCSKEGEPFVIHDNNLKRTTNGKGEVGLVEAAYIQSLDAGRWFSKHFALEKVPHFADVLQWLAFSGMQANIEIKAYPNTVEQTTQAILRHLSQYWPADKSLPLISSFDWDALDCCYAISPEMPLGLLMHSWREDWLKQAQKRRCYSIHLYKKIVNEARVKMMKEQGLAVCVYTVNRKKEAEKLLEWGVDAVFSDYPDLLSL